MTVLDAIATFAPYAFVLPNLWIAVAYLVAAIRVRRIQLPRQGVSLVVPLTSMLFWSVWLILMSNSARRVGDSGWMLVWYGFYIAYGVLAVNKLRPTSKSIQPWQKFGFASLKDFLLFQPLSDAQLVSDLSNTVNSGQGENRSIIRLALLVSICAAGLSYLGDNLQPCKWLDIATGRSGCLKAIDYPEGSVNEIALSSDARLVAAAGWFAPVRFYNLTDGSLVREMPTQQIDCGRGVSFSPDDRQVATLSKDGVVTILDVQSAALIHALSASTNTLGLRFSPDGKYLAVSVRSSGLQLWRTTDWRLYWNIPVTAPWFSFSADGRWLAANTDGNRIGIWDLTTGAVSQTIKARAYEIALSPDGALLATITYNDHVNIWDVSTGQMVRTIGEHVRGELVFSNDGRYLVTSESYAPVMSYIHQISVWRVADGQQILVLPANNFVDCIASAAKTNIFAYGTWKSLRVFRLRQD